jgi:hypothetical protein
VAGGAGTQERAVATGPARLTEKMAICRKKHGEGAGLAICRARRPPGKEEGATRALHASEPMTQLGDAPQPGDGEGQNRTGDTTIFSRGSWCNCRARADAPAEDLPANRIYRIYRDLRSVIA